MSHRCRYLIPRLSICLLALLVPLMAPAADLPAWEPAVWNDFPVRVELGDRADLERLLAEVPVASFNREQLRPRPGGGLVWEPRVTALEAAALNRAGRTFTRLPDLLRQGRTATEATWTQRALAKAQLAPGELTTYPTHAEIGTLLQQIATAHPAIARTVTWGTSVDGRELWGLVISDDVTNTEAEPEVRLSSTMHGDEVVGMVMLLNLAEYLTTNYGQAGFENVTDLVDGTEIHLLPLHNPDGYVAGRRTNANFVDLNRNYDEPAGTHSTLEQENLVVMAYSEARHFVISGNAHGGALVVNYPWDYTYTLAPDDAAMQALSLEYASHNPPMSASPFFPGGITNGAAWYVALGTLQDWSYDQTGCIDVTLELSNVKWPPESELAQYWLENRDSYLAYAASARYGVHGVVTDVVTGAPLAATVAVTGNAQPVVTDPAHGDYYKLLPTGTWTLTVTADGYLPAVIADVGTVWGTEKVVDVALQPDPSRVPGVPVLNMKSAPNPFNGGTTISFLNPRDGWVELTVYDLRGRRVTRLIADHRPAGPDSVRWDGTDDNGRRVGSGVYLARLEGANGGIAVVKVGVVK